MANAAIARMRSTPQAQPLLAPNWFLGLVPRQYWNVKKQFFIYAQEFLPINANATATGNVQVQNDSHFLCVGGTALVTDTLNTTIINSPSNANASAKLLSITDVAAGFPVSQIAVPLESLFGTAMLPALWPIPKLFRKGTTIATQIQNVAGANHNVRLAYWGIRIYPSIPAEVS